MGVFDKIKKSEYVVNMQNAAKTQLSLINTLNELQSEYEKLFEEHKKLQAELLKSKNNKG